jgi:hypothetical protein
MRVRKKSTRKNSDNKLLGRVSLSRLANKSLWFITISGRVGEGGEGKGAGSVNQLTHSSSLDREATMP